MRRLLLVLPLVLLACGGDDDDSAAARTTTSTAKMTTSTTTSTSAPSTSTTAFDGSTDPTSNTSVPANGNALLTDVRIGAEGGVERAVFEFRAGLPGYDIEYVDPPITSDGSGEEIKVEGNAFLKVVMLSATGYDFDAGKDSYTGPDRVTGGTSLITEVVAAGDFEGYLTWVIGLDRKVPYRVLTLDHRLVIELDASTT